MLSPAICLIMNGLFFTLRLSASGGSFPRPLKAAEEREYLERCANGDLEARNILVEHNLRLVAHIVKNGYGSMVVLSLEQYAALTDEVELRLDEADRAAAADTVRYTEEEVFGRVRSRLHERKAL